MKTARINPNELELSERIIYINRVAKVVKGGRRFSFSVIVVVGDTKGHVGVGLGKAKEVPEAIRKAGEAAKKSLFSVPLSQGTFPHAISGKFGASHVYLMPASEGTGVIAGGACRSVLEMCGVRNALTKSYGSSNPHNLVRATIHGLKSLRSAEAVSADRRQSAEISSR